MNKKGYVSTIGIFLCLLTGGVDMSARPGEDFLNDSVPSRWLYQGVYDDVAREDDKWWTVLGDATLDSLIEVGLRNNYNVLMAVHRLQAAEAAVGAARSGWYPSVGANASWTRQRSSGMGAGDASSSSVWNMGLNMSWQIDLFGKIYSQTKQKQAIYNASRADMAGVMLTLSSTIATNYIQLRVWQAQLQVAQEHIARQKKVVKLTEDRMEVGLANMLDVTQAREVYYSTQASIPGLENGIFRVINVIATLLGEYPDRLLSTLSRNISMPDYRHLVPIGLPAELLRRRPDVVSAEMQLAALAQSVGIAKKDFLPTLSINGSIGTTASETKDLFKNSTVGYSITPTFSWTLFNGFQRKYNLNAAKAQMESAMDNYNLTVLTAVQEVEVAMRAYRGALLQIETIEDVLIDSNKALALSLDLYKSKLTSFNNVVSAQMNSLANQNNLIVAQGQAMTSLIQIYVATGGGWQGL